MEFNDTKFHLFGPMTAVGENWATSKRTFLSDIKKAKVIDD